jgi:hypothetical protein
MSSVQFGCVASCFVIGTVPALPSSFACSSIPPLGVHHLHVRVAFTHSAVHHLSDAFTHCAPLLFTHSAAPRV